MVEESKLLQISLQVFQNVRDTSLYFVPMVVLLRVFTNNITGSSVYSYGSIIKGLVYFLLLAYGFEYILKILFDIPGSLAPSFAVKNKILDATNELQEEGLIPSIPTYLRWLLEVIVASLYHVGMFIHALMMVLLSSLAPIIFFLACLLGVGPGLSVFFGLIVLVSVWPVMWYGLDLLTNTFVSAPGSGFSAYIQEIVVLLTKILGPFLAVFSALSSGVGREAIQGTKAAISGASSFGSRVNNTSQMVKTSSSKAYQRVYKHYQGFKKPKQQPDYIRPNVRGRLSVKENK